MRRGRELGCIGVAALVALTGCGGGTRQDAKEPSGDFKVRIVRASFPAAQQLAQVSQMRIAVRNADTQTIPDVAVTVNSFTRRAVGTSDADPTRPIWIVDKAPVGGDTADKGTWALGALAPGQTKTFVWRVTAVDPGKFSVSYRVDAGLNGKAVAKLNDGSIPRGVFKVNVTTQPSLAHVDPNTGRVIRTPASQPQSAGSNGSGSSTGGVVHTGKPKTPPPPGY